MALQFQVPQFIEVEDKIFGPLSIRQFMYLAGGAGALFLIYKTLPMFLVVLLGLPVGGFALALAFYKVNGQPFVKVLEDGFKYMTNSKIYVWKKAEEKNENVPTITKIGNEDTGTVTPSSVTKDKLRELAWSLDIKEKIK